MAASTEALKPIEFGLLLIPHYQWLDAAGPVDYINQHNRTLLTAVGLPPFLTNKAPLISFHYISSTGTMDPVPASSGPAGLPTTTFKDCPALDYILVPGPDPNHVLSEECVAFLKEQFSGLKALLTVCTGSMLLAQTGLLDGVRAATNKWSLRMAVETGQFAAKYKAVKWVVDERFVVDGKIWSAAGVTSGIDLAAEFSKVHFDEAIVQLAREVSEYDANRSKPDPFAYILEGVELK